MSIDYLTNSAEEWSQERAPNAEIWVRQHRSGHVVHFQISADGSDLTKQSEMVPNASSRFDWEDITPSARQAAYKFLRERQSMLGGRAAI